MELPKIYLGSGLLSEFDRAIRLEWIITNGLGGYASSTILGINTRKYHGLLVAALNPPSERYVLLTKLDEEIRTGERVYLLGSNEFRGVIHPEGYRHLRGFTIDPFPVFNYEADGIYLRKTLFMPHLRNAVISWYEVHNSLNEPVEMRIHPLVNSRHFYNITNRYERHLGFLQDPLEDGVQIKADPPICNLIISSTEGRYSPGEEGGYWIENVYFGVDDSRGEACLDDNFQPGYFIIHLNPDERKSFYLTALAGKDEEEARSLHSAIHKEETLKALYEEELNRKRNLLEGFAKQNPGIKFEDWLKHLVISTDSFLVLRRSTGGRSIIAGYHWFEDWGRDSLISLPGLTLVTGRFEDARSILLTFKNHCKDGVIPNRFPEQAGDQPSYNTVDASLWFFNAVLQYLKYTGDLNFVYKELWETMRSIIRHYIEGTLFGIQMDEDHLIKHGPQLTWMDTSVEGNPVTPREGKAVEIQALWHNALKIMELLAGRFNEKDEAERYRSLADRVCESFNDKFWNPQRDCLLDVICDGFFDASMRPNQVIAVALDFSMLDDLRREKVVNTIWRRLWGTYGLRTLSEDDPKYLGRCIGDFSHRDRAYHNGTVWAWLLGPFATAFLKVKKYQDYWRGFAFENFMRPLFSEEIFKAGLGTISEIFDGDPPHEPRGCIAQAWSVAEPLRAFVEDVMLKRPLFERYLLKDVH